MESSYYSLWVRVPAYIVGGVVILTIMVYGTCILLKRSEEAESQESEYAGWQGMLLILYSLLVLTPAYFDAWNERQVIAAFAELLLAYTIPYAAGAAGIAAGYFVGKRVYIKFSKYILSWFIGILIAIIVFAAIFTISMKIPGIGWRIEKITESEHVDYDYDPTY